VHLGPARLIVLSLLLLCFGQARALAQVLDPPVIVDSFERARNQRDVDAALAFFADNAVVRVEERNAMSFTGKAEIRRFVQTMGVRPPPQVTSNRHVVGNTVSWSERAQGQGGQQQPPMDLKVEAIVQEGKIISLVYRVALPPPPASPQAESAARMPAVFAPLALLVVGGGLLLAASHTPRRGATSALHGRLIAALAQQHPRAKA
jgi:hypothetical protein